MGSTGRARWAHLVDRTMRRALTPRAAGALGLAAVAATVLLWPDPRSAEVLRHRHDAVESPSPEARRSSTSAPEPTTTTAAPSPTPPATTSPAPTAPVAGSTAPPAPPPAAASVPPCVPGPLPPAPGWGPDPTRYDGRTVQATPDPQGPRCGRTKVMVVGDSLGRGAANGLKRLRPGDLELWDRTEIGCGLIAPRSDCQGWRAAWTAAVAEVDPEVVLVYVGTSDDVSPGQDPPFLSPEGTADRRAVVDEALAVLSSRGARVAWALPAAPLPAAAFFCRGSVDQPPCDRASVDQWHRDLRAVAGARGVSVVDVRAWIDSRPRSTASDRPDGLHMSGPALDAHAAWLLAQLRAVIG